MVNYILATVVADPISGTDIYVLGWRKLVFQTIILNVLNFPKFIRDLKGKTQNKSKDRPLLKILQDH